MEKTLENSVQFQDSITQRASASSSIPSSTPPLPFRAFTPFFRSAIHRQLRSPGVTSGPLSFRLRFQCFIGRAIVSRLQFPTCDLDNQVFFPLLLRFPPWQVARVLPLPASFAVLLLLLISACVSSAIIQVSSFPSLAPVRRSLSLSLFLVRALGLFPTHGGRSSSH